MPRANPRVCESDIPKALAWFREETRRDAKLIVLHPSLEKLADAVPRGVRVEFAGGCLAWEIWLAAKSEVLPERYGIWGGEGAGVVSQVGAGILSTVNDKKIEVDKIQPTPPVVTRGRKSLKLPTERIRQLALSGMGSKAITRKLRDEGLLVSYKTVQRRLHE
jgi:hypothetical protein